MLGACETCGIGSAVATIGSDYSPRALYVASAPSRVAALLDDLIRSLNRDDLPVIVQAAIAHAQFEPIHPFTDGNGRIGRSLIGAVLRRRRVTVNTVMPIASGLLARRDEYFDTLTAYPSGDPDPFVRLLARSAAAATRQAQSSIDHLRTLPAEWRENGRPRARSALD